MKEKKSLNLVYRFGEMKKKGDILVTVANILLKEKRVLESALQIWKRKKGFLESAFPIRSSPEKKEGLESGLRICGSGDLRRKLWA